MCGVVYEFTGTSPEALIQGFAKEAGLSVRKEVRNYTKTELVPLCLEAFDFIADLIGQIYLESARKSDDSLTAKDAARVLDQGFVVFPREAYDQLLIQAKRNSGNSNMNPHSDLFKTKTGHRKVSKDVVPDPDLESSESGKSEAACTDSGMDDVMPKSEDGSAESERLKQEQASEDALLHDPKKGFRESSGLAPGKQEGTQGFGLKIPSDAEHQKMSIAVPARCVGCRFLQGCVASTDLSAHKNFIDIRFSAVAYPFRMAELDNCPINTPDEPDEDLRRIQRELDEEQRASGQQPETHAVRYTLITPDSLGISEDGEIINDSGAAVIPVERVMDGALFPKPVGTNMYGPNVHAAVNAGYCVLMSSTWRLQEVIANAAGITLSVGSCNNFVLQLAHELQPVAEGIRQVMLEEKVVHCDETGIDISSENDWIHSVSTAAYTFMSVQERRGKAGMDAAGFLDYFTGIVVHDCWSAYFKYTQSQHGLCNQHLLRELRGLGTYFYNCADWSEKMSDLLYRMKARRDDLASHGEKCIPSDERNVFRHQYEEILDEAFALFPEPLKTGKRGRPKNGKARSLLLRMKEHEDDFLRFMDDFDVPFSNNLAEQSFRLLGQKKHQVGCFRTLEGARAFVTVWSYLSTARKHGVSYDYALAEAAKGRAMKLIFPQGVDEAVRIAQSRSSN